MKKTFLILLMVLLPAMLFAGTTGKIAGYVRDVSTGDPLAGTNVMLEGTSFGAASDMNGYYVILNIPPGTYTLRATMMGYAVSEFTDLMVSVDQTTAQDIYMEQTAVEGEVVTVTAERPLVEVQNTSSRTIINASSITEAPVGNIQEMVQLTPGFSVGSPRGGRRNLGEIAYVVDGLDLNSALGTARVGAVPGQSTADGLATDIVELGLEEVEVLMGGFGAEYYQAPSAIVNVISREGGPEVSARFRHKVSYDVLGDWTSFMRPDDWISREDWFEMDKLVGQDWLDAVTDPDGPTYTDPATGETRYVQGKKFTTDYDVHNTEWSLSGPVPFVETMGIKGNLYWLFNGNIVNQQAPPETSVAPNARRTDSYELRTYEGKLTHVATNNKKLTLGFRISNSKRRFYDYSQGRVLNTGDVFTANAAPYGEKTIAPILGPNGEQVPAVDWDLTDGISRPEYFSHQISLNYTVPLSQTTFYEIVAQKFHTGQKRFSYDPFDGSPVTLEEFSEVRMNPSGALFDGFFWMDPMVITNQRQEDGQTRWQLKGSLSSQIHPAHLIKIGVEYQKYNLWFDRVSYASGGNLYNSQYEAEPTQIGGYIQDRIETKGMIVNLGLRLDFFDPNYVTPYDLSDPIKQDVYFAETTGENIYDVADRYVNPVDAEKVWQFSPRVGISHPIHEAATFHFTYGHYFTLPPLDNLYTNTAYDMRGAYKYIGNPNLKHQKIIAYETGVEIGLTNFMSLDVTAFYKDMADLVNSRKYVNTETGGVFWVFENADYAYAKGVEVSLMSRQWNNISGNIHYTYQIARGKNSNNTQAFSDDYNNRKPRTEDFPLDWDVRHTATANLEYRVGPDWGPTIGNKKWLGDWSLNMIFRFLSGQPYSGSARVSPPAHPPINDKRLPEEYYFDLRFTKHFQVVDRFSVGFFIDVLNVLDHRNLVDLVDIERYEVEGDPDGQWNADEDGVATQLGDIWSQPRRVMLGIDLRY